MGGVCGRYLNTRSTVELADHFDAAVAAADLAPSWNVAPTDPVPLVLETPDGERLLVAGRWGVPRPGKPGAVVINARVETAAERPTFAPLLAGSRCLLPADGWYEWADVDGRRAPHLLAPPGGGVLALAGVYLPGAEPRTVVITGPSTGPGAWVHDRTPLAVPRDAWAAWLDPGCRDDLRGALVAASTQVTVRRVSRAVNAVANNGPELLTHRVPEPVQPSLF